jgi:hypothetical protein
MRRARAEGFTESRRALPKAANQGNHAAMERYKLYGKLESWSHESG